LVRGEARAAALAVVAHDGDGDGDGQMERSVPGALHERR
jgi:hypothetical protein